MEVAGKCRYTNTSVQNAVRSRKFFRNFRISRWLNASIVLASFISLFLTAASIWRVPVGTSPITPISQGPTAPLPRNRINRKHPTAQNHPPKRRPPKPPLTAPLHSRHRIDPELFFSEKFLKNQNNWAPTSLQTKKGDYYFSTIQHNLFKSFINMFQF